MAAPGPGGGVTGSLLFFSPRLQVNDLYVSSSAQATQSTGTVPIPNNPLNTRLFYLGSGFGNSEAGGWYGSETSSFSGSQHNRLFWMYGNSTNFANEYSNLYYTTFQSRSLTATTFTTGVLGSDAASQNNNFTNPNYAGAYAAATPPTNAPSYNYQLIVSKSTQTSLGADVWADITAWTSITKDSLRSGSGNTVFETSGQGYKGQFNTSSGTYTFIRGNLPTASVTPVRAIPVNYTMSFEAQHVSGVTTNWDVRIVSGSTPNVLDSPPAQTVGAGTSYVSLTFSGSLNIYSGSNASAANLGNIALGSNNAMRVQIYQYNVNDSTTNYRSASLVINQPLTGKQIAFEVPLINIFNVTNTPTANDTGSYYVITPNLRGVDNIITPNVGGPGPGEDAYQLNYIGAIYYFKTAYHLWRDAWKVQAADGNPICPQNIWISASSNPSWAANAAGTAVNVGSVVTRNAGFLYASRSAAQAFIDYGTSSIDAAVRNRSYVGITAELLGGSELIKHLKANFAGTTSASFAGNKFGGMIVVKASNVGTDSGVASYRYFPGEGSPSTFIWYKPGLSDGSQTTISNVGLPTTQVNNGDVVPLSNFGYDSTANNLNWPTSITWPPANPYSADSTYGYP